jgi:hypothetical protein
MMEFLDESLMEEMVFRILGKGSVKKEKPVLSSDYNLLA